MTVAPTSWPACNDWCRTATPPATAATGLSSLRKATDVPRKQLNAAQPQDVGERSSGSSPPDDAQPPAESRRGGRRAQIPTALAEAMFRESTPPAIGIFTTTSAPLTASRERPSPSVPKTIASRSG